jgi:hypothetical protein
MDKTIVVATSIIVVALLVVTGFYGYGQGWFDKKTETPAEPKVIVLNPQNAQNPVVQPNAPLVPATKSVPVESLTGVLKNKFTMAAVTDGFYRFYTVGADVSDPYVKALDSIDVSGGASTNLVVQTGKAYDIYYESDGATYYDEKIDNWQINYNPETGKGYLMSGDKSYLGISPVGAFVDPTSTPEEQAGMNDTAGNAIYYGNATLGGSGWWKMDIGNNNANSVLKDVVMCFRDNDGDMEGNEVTAFTASYDSGTTAIQIPGSLQQYWEDAMGGAGAQCFKIASELGGSQKARWQFSMTVDETTWIESEEFEMTFDDLGGYLAKQYPSRSVKAAAVSLTVGLHGVTWGA